MLTVRYALTRNEVWRWYWKAWCQRLWMVHALSAVVTVLAFSVYDLGGSLARSMGLGVLASLILAGAMIGYPQLRYRPEERILTANTEGLSYVRGSQTGQVKWKVVRSAEFRDGDVIVSGRGGSAFIIPERAFASQEEALRFLEFINVRVRY